VPLTQFAITNAAPKEKPYKLLDGDGLHLLVKPGGSKLWRFHYVFRGKENMLSLGSFPEISLASARQKRDEARRSVAEGRDPSQQRKLDKIAAATAAQNTFGALAAEYLQNLKDGGAAESTIAKNKWFLEDLAAPIASRPIAEITPAELLQLLKKIKVNLL
jgi:hypothetical protein